MTITVSAEPVSPYCLQSRMAKRVLDIAIATIALLVTFPVFVIAALAIVIESPGPLFYRARRVGWGGRDLAVLKLRKMCAGATGLPLTLADDDRFTRIGRLLSVTHIDEIPQLWQVLTGKMSIIGPRPEDARFVDLHHDAFQQIVRVRPGISGWTQLLFIDERQLIASAEAVQAYAERLLPAKVELDLLYATHRRFIHDMKLILWTPLVMLSRFEVVFIPALRQFRLIRTAAPTGNPPLSTHTTGGTARVPTPRGESPLEHK